MIWNYLDHFNPRERWGDPKRVSPLLLTVLDALRDYFNAPIIIHCAYATSGHVPHSYHYIGAAADFHVKTDLPFNEQVKKVQEFLKSYYFEVFHSTSRGRPVLLDDICGLGIYPDWNPPGFHLDVRGYRARWGAIGDKYVGFLEALHHYQEKTKKEEGHA